MESATLEIRIGQDPFQGRTAILTSNDAVFDTEQLSFVVARDCGVRVDITREHWEAGGQVFLHPFFFLSSFDLNVV